MSGMKHSKKKAAPKSKWTPTLRVGSDANAEQDNEAVEVLGAKLGLKGDGAVPQEFVEEGLDMFLNLPRYTPGAQLSDDDDGLLNKNDGRKLKSSTKLHTQDDDEDRTKKDDGRKKKASTKKQAQSVAVPPTAAKRDDSSAAKVPLCLCYVFCSEAHIFCGHQVKAGAVAATPAKAQEDVKVF
jgi:hypothetical protein